MKSLTTGSDIRSYLKAVRLFFLFASLEGGMAAVYLTLSLSNIQTTGLSSTQWLMPVFIIFILLMSSVFIWLFLKSLRDELWAARFVTKLLERRNTIPHFLLTCLVAIFVAFTLLVMFLSDKSSYVLTILFANGFALIVFWIVLVLLHLWGIWLWFWKRMEVLLPDFLPDILAGAILVLIAFAARALLTGYGLPYETVWDEPTVYPHALNMLTEPGLHPYTSGIPLYGKASYGDLLVYLTLVGEVLGLLNGFRTQQIHSVAEFVLPPAGTSIYGAVHPSGIPLQAPRLVFALINSFAPLGIYYILRRYFKVNRWLAFGGGLIYAIYSWDATFHSAFLWPDSLSATLMTFMLIAAAECLNDSSVRLKPYIFLGVLCGMIISVSIRSVSVVIIPIMVLILGKDYRQFPRNLLTVGMSAFLGFALTSPYALLDLPNQLERWFGLTWMHDPSWMHRLESLVFYFDRIFRIGPVYGGMGFLVALLAILGMAKLIYHHPRYMLVMGAVFMLHLYLITPIVQRYIRHALLLYPIISIAAGLGLSWLAENLVDRLRQYRGLKMDAVSLQHGMPVMVFAVFLLLSARQVGGVIAGVRLVHRYQPVQVQAAIYLKNILQPGDKVGILDAIPWIEVDLNDRQIPFERVGLTDSVQSLRERQITIVVGTDRLGGDYAVADDNPGSRDNMWKSIFPDLKMKGFGVRPLERVTYPAGDLYLYVARVPVR